jgi:hypothetical protein
MGKIKEKLNLKDKRKKRGNKRISVQRKIFYTMFSVLILLQICFRQQISSVTRIVAQK